MERGVVVWLLVAACGGSSEAPARAGDGEGTSITFEQRVGWPFELRSLAVAVDGELTYVEHEAHRRAPPGEVARVPLAPGEHTVSVHAVLTHPCAPLSDAREWLRLRGAKTFRVGDDPGRVEVLVTAQGPGIGTLDERVRLAFAARGVSFVEAASNPTLPGDEHLGGVRTSLVEGCGRYQEPAEREAWPVPDVPLMPPPTFEPSI